MKTRIMNIIKFITKWYERLLNPTKILWISYHDLKSLYLDYLGYTTGRQAFQVTTTYHISITSENIMNYVNEIKKRKIRYICADEVVDLNSLYSIYLLLDDPKYKFYKIEYMKGSNGILVINKWRYLNDIFEKNKTTYK